MRPMTSPYAVLARYYDLQHNRFTADAPLYTALADQYRTGPGARILEIGCGTGRVMAPLLEAGHTIVGLDESQDMLDLGARRLAGFPADRWQLIKADARRFALGERFDLAVIALNTFLHCADRDDQLAILRSARAHLRAGGALAVDLPPNDELAHQPDDGELHFEAKFTDPDSGSLIVKHVASEVGWATQSQRLRYWIEERDTSGQRSVRETAFTLRHVFRHEMELLLLASGYGEWDWFGGYDLGPYLDDSARMIVVAR